jgi:hypothetical protein
MAVLDTLPGLSVSIHVDGEPLPEYEDEAEEEIPDGPVAVFQAARTVCKYVEATSEKEFCIKMSLNAPYRMDCPSVKFRCFIDGIRVRTKILRRSVYPDRIRRGRVVSPVETTVEGVTVEAPGRSDHEFVRKFKFAKIELCMFFQVTACFIIC